MKLLTSSEEISSEFTRLMNQYPRYLWAVAWAGSIENFTIADLLEKNLSKISKLSFGLHFNQTHPNFIRKFYKTKNIRFVDAESNFSKGIFHPKIFLFESGLSWELMIGSANFTRSAFQKNKEAVFLVSSIDKNSTETYNKAKEYLDDVFFNSKEMTEESLQEYEALWHQNNELKEEIITDFEIKEKKTQSISTKGELQLWNWAEYFEKLIQKGENSIIRRLELLESSREMFQKREFKAMTEYERKKILGLVHWGDDGINWEMFGNVKTVRISFNSYDIGKEIISDALEQIPIEGKILKANYEEFVKRLRTFHHKKLMLLGSRILALKRPDVFLPTSHTNRKELNHYLRNEVHVGESDFEKYYDEIVHKIEASEWCYASEPTDTFEKRVWQCRVAMLDLLFYQEKEPIEISE